MNALLALLSFQDGKGSAARTVRVGNRRATTNEINRGFFITIRKLD
jgi:hypothetical protein